MPRSEDGANGYEFTPPDADEVAARFRSVSARLEECTIRVGIGLNDLDHAWSSGAKEAFFDHRRLVPQSLDHLAQALREDASEIESARVTLPVSTLVGDPKSR